MNALSPDLPTVDGFTQAEWKGAEELHLRCEPRSVEAALLVDRLLADLKFSGGAGPVRPSTIAKRKRALGALLADLLRLQTAETIGSHSMARQHFPSKALGFGFEVFGPLKDAMVTAGLLRFSPGRQRLQRPEGFGGGPSAVRNLGGWVARFGLTPATLERVIAAGVDLETWSVHWQRCSAPKKPLAPPASLPPLVQLKASHRRHQGTVRRGEALPVDPGHPMVQQTLADLEAHNAFMRDRVEGIDFLGLRRVFNEGDRSDRLYRSGGRFYSIRHNGFGTIYEGMAGGERRRCLRIAGQPVGEADMNASQFRLFYALQDAEMPEWALEDPYAVPGMEREAVKAVVAQAFGSNSIAARGWSAEAKREYAKRHEGRSLATDRPFRPIRDAIVAAHPLLGRLGEDGTPSVLDLQFVESEVLRQAMRTLRERGVGCLPVHDSLIAGVADLAEVSLSLEKAFNDQVRQAVGRDTHHRMTIRLKQEP